MPELIANATNYIIFIAVSIGVQLFSILAKDAASKRSFLTIRRVPSIDAIDEAVRSCAEKGRPSFWSPGWGGSITSAATAIYGPGEFAICRECARLSGEVGIPLYMLAGDPNVNLIIRDSAREGFSESGRPELYDDSKVFWTPGRGYLYTAISIIENFRPGVVIITGCFGSGTNSQVLEVARRVGAISIAGEMWPHETSHGAIAADYLMLPEEMVAAGALLSDDPTSQSTVLGNDLIKLWSILILLFFVVMTLISGGI